MSKQIITKLFKNNRETIAKIKNQSDFEEFFPKLAQVCDLRTLTELFFKIDLKDIFERDLKKNRDDKCELFKFYLTEYNYEMINYMIEIFGGYHYIFSSQLCDFNNFAVLKYLHKKGFDITFDDNSMIINAAKHGHLKLVKYLHQNGADVTAQNNYAIIRAANNGHLPVVKYLHENGADITAQNNYVICVASENGHLEVVKYLHQNGADITIDDNSPIRCASKYGYLPIVKYLYENIPNASDLNNVILKNAINEDHMEIVKYIAEKL